VAEPAGHKPRTNSVSLLLSFRVAASDRSVVIEGEIFDRQCVRGVHSPDSGHGVTIENSTMERKLQERTRACAANHREYVLVDAENDQLHYIVEQEQTAKFSGKRVLVRGIRQGWGSFD